MTEGFSWENRRKWVARILWWCGAMGAACATAMFIPSVTADKISAVMLPVAGLAAATVGSYLFGAAYENVKGGR